MKPVGGAKILQEARFFSDDHWLHHPMNVKISNFNSYIYSDLIIPGLVTNGNCQNMLSWLDFSAILKHHGH